MHQIRSRPRCDVLDLQTTTTYDAFGNVVSVVIEQNTTKDLDEDDGSWCFDGLEMDVDDDALQYHQARFYDPAQGRWLDDSPLGLAPATPIFTDTHTRAETHLNPASSSCIIKRNRLTWINW